jgi:hypothetical protein
MNKKTLETYAHKAITELGVKEVLTICLGHVLVWTESLDKADIDRFVEIIGKIEAKNETKDQ